MQNDIERMLVESRSLGFVGRFLHRYEKCQTALASLADDDASTGIPASRTERSGWVKDRSQMPRDISVAAELVAKGRCPPQAASASRYMTIFLEAYVAARQVSAKNGSHSAGK